MRMHTSGTASGTILSPNTIFTVGCWNVRSLYSPGAVKLLVQELKHFKWDVVGIAETHLTGVDDIREGECSIISSGGEGAHRAGVALVIGKSASAALISSKPVSDRIISARFKTATGHLTIVQVYAPTMAASNSVMEEFYDQLQEELNSIPASDIVVVTGDFNAKVGAREEGEEGAVGRFGLGQRNGRGDMLVDFCCANNLCITNTFYRQAKENRYWTWESPDGKIRNQIDYILVSKRLQGSVRNSRAYPSAEVGSDHQLVLANIKLKVKKTEKGDRFYKTDIAKLKDEKILNTYKVRMENQWESLAVKNQGQGQVEEKWGNIKAAFKGAAEEVLGQTKGGRQTEWLTEKTRQLAEERRIARTKRDEGPVAKKHHNFLCRQVKENARQDRESYIGQLCESIENCQKQNKSREVYEGVRKLTGKHVSKVSAVKDKQGKMLTDGQEVRGRWKEYFEELYNDPNAVCTANLPELPLHNEDEETPEILMDEVVDAVNQLRRFKAVGYDGISAEEIQAAMTGKGLEVMLALCRDIWEEEQIPSDWKRAIIVPIHKKKDKMECNNYRGVSLLCHSSKIFSRILLNRLRKRTEEILSEEQAGFRAGRSTIDQIFTLRQLAEKYIEMDRGLYVGYIDFKKAFDSVWREGLWRVMRHLGYEEKTVRILESMYQGTFSAVRAGGNLSDWFETTVGVLQGCALSPLLFNVFLEAIMGRALAEREEGAIIGGNLISNLRFADDIGALAESNQGLQDNMNSISLEAERLGMKMNLEKTEVQYIGKEKVAMDISIGGTTLKQVDEFVYLGSKIEGNGSSDQDVKRRIGLANGVVQSLASIWRAEGISVKTKVRVYETLVLSLLLYNSETWALKEETKQRLLVFEMACLRRITGISRRERIRNTVIRGKAGVKENILQKIARSRMRYLGHVIRMPNSRFPNMAFYGQVHGQRSRGRPRMRWIDNVKKDCERAGITIVQATQDAADRILWKSRVEKSTRAIASPGP